MDNNKSSNGIGSRGVIFTVLLTLKLTHTIDWSWWWITAPLWIGAIYYFIISMIYLKLEAKKHKAEEEKNILKKVKEIKFLLRLQELMKENESISKLN